MQKRFTRISADRMATGNRESCQVIRGCNPCASWGMAGVCTPCTRSPDSGAHAHDHAHASRCFPSFLTGEAQGVCGCPSLLWLRGMKPGRLLMLVGKRARTSNLGDTTEVWKTL